MTLSTTTQQRLLRHLAQRWHIDASVLKQQTQMIARDSHAVDDWDSIWHLWHGSHVIHTNPKHITAYQTAIAACGDDLSQLIRRLPVQHTATAEHFYTIDASTLSPLAVPEGFQVRQLTQHDTDAFTAFKGRCSEADKAQGQIGLDDEAVFAAFDGRRIGAAASSFEWYGFVDVGVLTDPDYRQRGLGAAVITALTQYHLTLADETRLPLYRHEATNSGSRGVARRCGYVEFAEIEYLKLAIS